MAEQNTTGDAPNVHVPQWILEQANPDCPKCIEVLTRSQKRHRERMEAIRNYERLQQHTQHLESDFKNYVIMAERKIQQFQERLEQEVAANKFLLESTIPLEEHNEKIIQKANECRASLQQITDGIKKVYGEEKETLLARLINKEHELGSEKRHKELLVKKVRDQRTEMDNIIKEKSNDAKGKSQLQDEAAANLNKTIQVREQEIEWLKNQIQQREEEHRQAMTPRKDPIHKPQSTTPSSQRGNRSNNILYRETVPASPSTIAPTLQKPGRRNGTPASSVPPKRARVAQVPNPTQQLPAMHSHDAMKALQDINVMRQTPHANNVPALYLPQKPIPNIAWNLPLNPMNNFQGNMPIFPQPTQHLTSQYANNQGYQFIDDDLEIMSTTYKDAPMNPAHANDSYGGYSKSGFTGQFQHLSDNPAPLGYASGASFPDSQQYGSLPHITDHHEIPPQIPRRAASQASLRSPSRVSARGGPRISNPKDIPDGGYRGVVCKNCHSEWWNTWCDAEKEACTNCQQDGVLCERPACPQFRDCKNPNCKAAHEDHGFRYTFEMPGGKHGMRRKNKMTDSHDEPPMKKMKDLGHPALQK